MTRSSRWPGDQGTHSPIAVAVRRGLTRWLPHVLGGAVALALIFWLYRDLDLGRFLAGLAEA